MNGQNSKDKYRKNKEASIKLQIEITEKEAKRIALTYATISLGVFGIGGFLTYLGCVGVYAGISTIKEFGILYLVCAMFIMFQPENPWSLDRGMNGVRYRIHIY